MLGDWMRNARPDLEAVINAGVSPPEKGSLDELMSSSNYRTFM